MHVKQFQELHKKQQQKNSDFYTPNGLHVYFKEPPLNDEIDLEAVVGRIESMIPSHLFSEVEMIIVGWFDEFAERSINAFYDAGTIYVSNAQSNNDDIIDDLIHELAHSLEVPYGYDIYADGKVKDEFLRKRVHLQDILWSKGYKAPKAFFMNFEYSEEFDKFLYEKVGYNVLAGLMQGLFVNPYAATSLREYFATGFTEFYLDTNHDFLQKLSPALYKKIYSLHQAEVLDNA
jgi:hypothetical protein